MAGGDGNRRDQAGEGGTEGKSAGKGGGIWGMMWKLLEPRRVTLVRTSTNAGYRA